MLQITHIFSNAQLRKTRTVIRRASQKHLSNCWRRAKVFDLTHAWFESHTARKATSNTKKWNEMFISLDTASSWYCTLYPQFFGDYSHALTISPIIYTGIYIAANHRIFAPCFKHRRRRESLDTQKTPKFVREKSRKNLFNNSRPLILLTSPWKWIEVLAHKKPTYCT